MLNSSAIHKSPALLRLAFWGYLAVLLRITVFRSGFGAAPLCSGQLNLTLFRAYGPLLAQGQWRRFLYLFVGNLVWFMPLGAWLVYTGRTRRAVSAALCGTALSLGIETMQFVFGTGVSELDDLVLNTLGALLGAVAMRLWQRFAPHRKVTSG